MNKEIKINDKVFVEIDNSNLTKALLNKAVSQKYLSQTFDNYKIIKTDNEMLIVDKEKVLVITNDGLYLIEDSSFLKSGKINHSFYKFSKLNSSEYYGVVTITNHEVSVRDYLKKEVFLTDGNECKILVDLVAISGLKSRYRFIDFIITADGKKIFKDNSYITPDEKIEDICNEILLKEIKKGFNGLLTSLDMENLRQQYSR